VDFPAPICKYFGLLPVLPTTPIFSQGLMQIEKLDNAGGRPSLY
jgi:hypothetical protein